LRGPVAVAAAALALAAVPALAGAPRAEARPFEEMSERTRRAIGRGLEFLDRSQSRDGSWSSNGNYIAAMTALSGTAFLGAGHTPGRGRYGKNVERAVSFLLRHQDRTGLIATPSEGGRAMYGHGFSTTFLSQACGMDSDPERTGRVRKAVQRAVMLIARSQSPAGGWYYTPESRTDEGSVTVTQVQALRAARNIGATVPGKTIDRAVNYMKKSQNADGSIRYRVSMGGGGRPPLTAAGCEVFFSLGMYDAPETQKALKNLRQQMGNNRSWGHQTYFIFYAAQAFFQAGGDDWRKYYPKMRDIILNSQKGSGEWQGDHVGGVYGTALSLMVLEIPWRYLPIFQR